MGIISITPDEMISQANSFIMEAQNIDDLIMRLTSLQSQVNEQWKGQASIAFSSNYEQLKPSFMQMSENLKTHAQNLIQSANAMQEMDQQLSSQLMQ